MGAIWIIMITGLLIASMVAYSYWESTFNTTSTSFRFLVFNVVLASAWTTSTVMYLIS